ncbi:uncharacterized protein C2orf81 homolog [Discoglossus pictus]
MSKTSTAKGGTTQAGSRAAASKSRIDKSHSVPVVAPTPQAVMEIVLGRLTEEDWMYMVILEDDENMIGDTMESLDIQVTEQCSQAYLARQVMPYALKQAQEAMTQKMNLIYMSKEEGNLEVAVERTWQDEEEPCQCPIESWMGECPPTAIPCFLHPHSKQSQVTIKPSESQKIDPRLDGTKSVSEPKLYSPCLEPKAKYMQETKNGTENNQTVTTASQISPLASQTSQLSCRTSPIASQTSQIASQTSQLARQQTSSLKPLKKRYQPHNGPLRSAGLRNITKSLEDTEKEMLKEQELKMREEDKEDDNLNLLPTSLHNILKIQMGRPPQKKDVVYDALGNVLSMPKLDPSTLPRHCIQPQVTVLEPTKEADSKVKKTVQSGGPTSGKRQKQDLKSIGKGDVFNVMSSMNSQIAGEKSYKPYFTGTSKVEATSLPIPLSAGIQLDKMQLTHGVTLRGSDNTVRGSLPSLQVKEKGTERRELKPILPMVPLPSIPLDQVIRNNIPQVHPLSFSRPNPM